MTCYRQSPSSVRNGGRSFQLRKNGYLEYLYYTIRAIGKWGSAHGGGTIKVIIDRQQCVSCGSCWDTCPAFFIQNTEDSFSEIVEEYRNDGNIAEGTPPAEAEDCARDAADLCPAQIIQIEE